MKSILLLALSVAIQIMAFAQIPTSGLVAYWPLNGNFNDAGTNSINGTNSASTATTNKNGVANSAMSFANPNPTATVVGQYATHPINSNVNFSSAQDFTICFSTFINSPVIHACGFYDNNLNYGGPGVWFWNSNGFPQVQFNFKNNYVGTTNGAISLGTWHFIVAVKESGNIKIYVNGVINSTALAGTTSPTYSFPARFGSMFANSFSPPQYNGLNGKLDELRIYNRALTGAEITAMSASVLPIKLSSFTAENKNDVVNVQWKTTEEVNTSHFEVERSIDGTNFNEVGRVNASGNTSISQNYAYNDKLSTTMLSEPKIYYRLKSVDIDGKFTYSKIAAVVLKKANEPLTIYPTPTNKILNVQTISSYNGKATILITDITGKTLLQKDITLFIGKNSVPCDVSSLQHGLYNVQLKTNNDSYTKQFMKIE